jgi:hypothetical protein
MGVKMGKEGGKRKIRAAKIYGLAASPSHFQKKSLL